MRSLLARANWPWLACTLVAIVLASSWPALGERRAAAEQALVAAGATLAWMQAGAEEARVLRAGTREAGPRAAVDLLSVVDRRVRGSSVSPWVRGLEPEGTSAVALSVEDAVFDALLLWLGTLRQQDGLRVERLALQRAGDGRVQGRIVLSGAAR